MRRSFLDECRGEKYERMLLALSVLAVHASIEHCANRKDCKSPPDTLTFNTSLLNPHVSAVAGEIVTPIPVKKLLMVFASCRTHILRAGPHRVSARATECVAARKAESARGVEKRGQVATESISTLAKARGRAFRGIRALMKFVEILRRGGKSFQALQPSDRTTHVTTHNPCGSLRTSDGQDGVV